MKSAIIAGATGLIGECLTRQLLDDSDFETVTVLVRKSGALSSQVKSPKLKELVVDYDRLAEKAEAMKATHWFCTLGTTIKKAGSKEAFIKVDRDYVLAFAKIAKEKNCESFHLVTALEANPKSMIFYGRVKGQVEESLKALNLKSLHIYRPSLLDGDRKENRPAERIAAAASRALGGLVPKSIRMIHVSKIARAMIAASKTVNAPQVQIFSSAQMQDIE